MNKSAIMRYRQLGYGIYNGTDWRAVWLDIESVETGNLLVYIFPTGSTPMLYTDTIYRTLSDVLTEINWRDSYHGLASQ